MIRIKDTIFNENEIQYIVEYSEKELQIMFKDHSDIYVEATFDDIEWNYGNTELEELKLDYSAVVAGYKKLEEHNKELVETNYDLAEKLKSHKEILKKVEEYIEKQLKDTKQCLEYNREQHNLFEVEKYTRDYNLYTNILERL